MLSHAPRFAVLITLLGASLPGQADCGGYNQTCETALWLSQGLTRGHNLCASTSAYNGSCEMYLDVWHKFRAPYSGVALLSFCTGGGNTCFHSTLAGFSGSCGSLVELACNQTTCMGRIVRVRRSEIRFPVVAGETYYVAVGSQLSTSMGASYNLFFRIDTYAACTFRNGTGVNGTGFECTTPPVIGRNWTSKIATNPDTISTFLGLGTTAGQQSLLGGELLISLNPPPIFLPGAGVFSVQVPDLPALIGARLFAQGFRVDLVFSTPTLVMLNAQDLLFGLP